MDRWLDPKTSGQHRWIQRRDPNRYGDWFLADWESGRPGRPTTPSACSTTASSLVGTDAALIMGSFTTAGESIHYEMGPGEAGIAPLKVIQAATSNNARILKIQQVTGSIAEGLAADLLLVKGDPTTDINATRNILQVINGGRIVNRELIARALTGR
jgi:hypothetical protein